MSTAPSTALDKAKQTKAWELLEQFPTAMRELFATKGWELWQEWSQQQVIAFKEMAIHGATPEEREEARISAISIELFCKMPLFLATLQTTEASPTDSPQAQAEVKE